MKASTTKMANGIYEAINRLATRFYARRRGNRRWTFGFKKELREIGEKQHYGVWGSYKDESEWLYDVAWVKGGKCWDEFKGLALACEMEWKESNDEHLADFLKLVACDCDLRVFVFGCRPGTQDRKFRLFQEKSRISPDKAYLAIAVPHTWNEPLPRRLWVSRAVRKK